MDNEIKKILSFIQVLRQSFSDAHIIYSWGGCYGFYEIMKHSFPKCKAHMLNNQHVLCKIGGKFYDIGGVVSVDKDDELRLMSDFDHFTASSWRDGQRVENMIRKYNNR